MKKILFVGLILLMSFSVKIQSEEVDEDNKIRARFGLWYHYGFNQHHAKDFGLPSITDCCDELSGGHGFGQSMGILLELPLNANTFFGLRAGFYDKYGLFDEDYKSHFDYNGVDTTLSVHQKLEANLSNISIEPYISAKIFNNLFLSFGYRFGYFIKRYYKYLYETQPKLDGITGQTTRSESIFDDIGEYDAALVFGLNYELSLNDNNTFLLVPEIVFETGVKNIYNDGSWKLNTLRGGISLKISPEISRKMIREIYLYDTLIVNRNDISTEYLKPGQSIIREYETKEKKVTYKVSEIFRIDTLFRPSSMRRETDLFTDISVYGKMAWGDVHSINSILAKVQMSKEIYPLLPYIFFEKSSSKLSMKYQDNTFELASYYPNPVKYHHNVLNILADRMLKNPHCRITLKGYIDETTEGNNCELAYLRAESVKNYLVRNCNIPDERIEIISNEAGCYPVNLTKALTDDRYEENRVVEIGCSNIKILEPISGNWYQKPIVITPDILYFDVSGSSLNKIDSWNFKFFQNKYSILDIKDKTKENIFEHKITEEEAYFLNSSEALTAEYLAYNDIGEFSSAKKDIKVFIDTLDYEVESLNLALFAVADSKLSESIESQVKTFVSHLDNNDKVYIFGYTDMLGNEDLNNELAKSRAYQIAMYINKVNSQVKIEKVEGIGTKKFAPGITSYKSPEERFLSRTVEIQIRRKRK